MEIIKDESVVFHDDVTVDEMMELALVATRIEHSDAIDAAITNYFENAEETLGQYDITKFVPFDPATKKVTAVATKKSTGEEITVVKGAPPVLMVSKGAAGRNQRLLLCIFILTTLLSSRTTLELSPKSLLKPNPH